MKIDLAPQIDCICRGAQVDRLAAADLDVEALVAPFHEGGELVDGEVVLDPIAELLGQIAGVVGNALAVSTDCQPP